MRGVTIETEVLVVGLGPAGARAAEAAAKEGRKVFAVDKRKDAGLPVQCAEFVPALLGQEIDGLEPVTRQRIDSMMTFVETDAPDAKGNFPGRMIDRAQFDKNLVDAARKAHAECNFGLALESLDASGIATLSDGTRIKAKVVIGADGPRSAVGRAIGRVNKDLVETRQISVPLLKPHGATDIYLSADIEGGYAWLFPKDNVANLGVGVAPAAKSALKPILEDLHRRLVVEGRVGAEVLGHTGGAIPVGGLLKPSEILGAVPVFLAGDAAGLTNPVTGAGIASATISGGLAGEAAVHWLRGDIEAPREYAEEIEALFGKALRRALARRKELLNRYKDGGQPSPADLRGGWIAYDAYWAA